MIPVAVNGVIVWHTEEEYARLWAGVDREVCELLEQEDHDGVPADA